MIEKANAKVNLLLLVTGKNNLNKLYHNINSIFCFTKDVYDTLDISYSLNNSDNITLKGSFAKELANTSNILNSTINYFRLRGCNIPFLNIVLHKNIPLGAGLGGGSCNAGALIRFFVKHHNVVINNKTLEHIAFNLGADIPACYINKQAFVSSVGNNVKSIKLPKFYLTLINPLQAKSTALFFKELKKYSLSVKDVDIQNINYNKLCLLVNKYGNDFTNIATLKYKVLIEIINFIKINGLTGGLTGSGLTVFALHENLQQAKAFEAKLLAKFPNFWVKVTAVL